MRKLTAIDVGAIAGVLYAVIAVLAGALTGAAPKADGNALTYQNYFIDTQDMLVLQGWIFPFTAPLLLMFSVAVRQILRKNSAYLADLFLVAQTVVATLVIAAMCVQIAVGQAAGTLDSQVLYTVGVHFPAVVVLMWGPMTATAAVCYATSVLTTASLPRWTAYVAILTAVVCIGATPAVFASAGPLSPEGQISAFAPAVLTVLWYLSVSIALLRRRTVNQ